MKEPSSESPPVGPLPTTGMAGAGHVDAHGTTPWRVGRKVGRTLYDRNDRLVGLVDTPDMASLVVDAVNGFFGKGVEPEVIAPPAPVMMYYIIDTRSVVGNCAMFWAHESKGYVCNLADAGKYEEAEAKQIQRSRGTDVAVPCDVIEALAVTHVRGDTHEFHEAMKAARRAPGSDAK